MKLVIGYIAFIFNTTYNRHRILSSSFRKLHMLKSIKRQTILSKLHFIQSLIGACAAISISFPSFIYCIKEPHPSVHSQATAIMGLVLLGYSLCQFWLIHKRNIKIFQAISYPIFYLLIGISLHITISGYI